MRHCFALVLLTTSASAQPVDIDVRVDVDVNAPGTVVPSPPPPQLPRYELSLHVGVIHASESFTEYQDYQFDGPHASGLAFDAGFDVRARPWFSVGATLAVSSITDRSVLTDYFDVPHEITNHFVELDAHARLRAAGAFVGAIGGYTVVRDANTYASGHRASSWYAGPALGLEAGYAFAGRPAPELAVAFTRTWVGDGTDVVPGMLASADLTLARATIGVAF